VELIVTDLVNVSVGVMEGDCVGLCDTVQVKVGVRERVTVRVGVGVEVCVRELECVRVHVLVIVSVEEDVGVFVSESDSVRVGVDVADGVAVGVILGVDDDECVPVVVPEPVDDVVNVDERVFVDVGLRVKVNDSVGL
jgi:hypothetical protein